VLSDFRLAYQLFDVHIDSILFIEMEPADVLLPT